MLRLAYFSDIHGNDRALKAVLRDINVNGVDLAVCGGDLVGYGARPNEVIQPIHLSTWPSCATRALSNRGATARVPCTS